MEGEYGNCDEGRQADNRLRYSKKQGNPHLEYHSAPCKIIKQISLTVLYHTRIQIIY